MIKVTVTTVHAGGEPEVRIDAQIRIDTASEAVRLRLNEVSVELAQEFAQWKARLEQKLQGDLELQLQP